MLFHLLILMVLRFSLQAVQQLGGQFRLLFGGHSREAHRYVNDGEIVQKRRVRRLVLVEQGIDGQLDQRTGFQALVYVRQDLHDLIIFFSYVFNFRFIIYMKKV